MLTIKVKGKPVALFVSSLRSDNAEKITLKLGCGFTGQGVEFTLRWRRRGGLYLSCSSRGTNDLLGSLKDLCVYCS